MQDYLVLNGLWRKTSEKIGGALSLKTVVKHYLKLFGVPFQDPCCPDAPTEALTPIAINKDGKVVNSVTGQILGTLTPENA